MAAVPTIPNNLLDIEYRAYRANTARKALMLLRQLISLDICHSIFKFLVLSKVELVWGVFRQEFPLPYGLWAIHACGVPQANAATSQLRIYAPTTGKLASYGEVVVTLAALGDLDELTAKAAACARKDWAKDNLRSQLAELITIRIRCRYSSLTETDWWIAYTNKTGTPAQQLVIRDLLKSTFGSKG